MPNEKEFASPRKQALADALQELEKGPWVDNAPCGRGEWRERQSKATEEKLELAIAVIKLLANAELYP